MVGTGSPSDPLRRLERGVRRRAWLAPAVPAVLFAAFVAIMTVLQTPTSDQLVSYAANIGSVFVLLLAFGLVMQYLAARSIRRFTPLASRVKEAGLSPRGPSLMLDNGLLVSFFLSGAFVTGFFGPDGSALHPRLGEALRWTGPRRLKFVRMVRVPSMGPARARAGLEAPLASLGPPEARAGLEALVTPLDVGFAIATAHESRAPPGELGGPRWVVAVNLFRQFGGPRVDLLASHVDDFEPFMKGFLQPALTGAAKRAFPWRQIAVSIAAMAVLPVLLAAAFLWSNLALIFLTVGIISILVVGSYGAYMMRGPRRSGR